MGNQLFLDINHSPALPGLGFEEDSDRKGGIDVYDTVTTGWTTTLTVPPEIEDPVDHLICGTAAALNAAMGTNIAPGKRIEYTEPRITALVQNMVKSERTGTVPMTITMIQGLLGMDETTRLDLLSVFMPHALGVVTPDIENYLGVGKTVAAAKLEWRGNLFALSYLHTNLNLCADERARVCSMLNGYSYTHANGIVHVLEPIIATPNFSISQLVPRVTVNGEDYMKGWRVINEALLKSGDHGRIMPDNNQHNYTWVTLMNGSQILVCFDPVIHRQDTYL